MLKNAYLVAKIGVDTAENEPPEEWCVAAMEPDGPARAEPSAPRGRPAARRPAAVVSSTQSIFLPFVNVKSFKRSSPDSPAYLKN